jgi:hypothetical protein
VNVGVLLFPIPGCCADAPEASAEQRQITAIPANPFPRMTGSWYKLHKSIIVFFIVVFLCYNSPAVLSGSALFVRAAAPRTAMPPRNRFP